MEQGRQPVCGESTVRLLLAKAEEQQEHDHDAAHDKVVRYPRILELDAPCRHDCGVARFVHRHRALQREQQQQLQRLLQPHTNLAATRAVLDARIEGEKEISLQVEQSLPKIRSYLILSYRYLEAKIDRSIYLSIYLEATNEGDLF